MEIRKRVSRLVKRVVPTVVAPPKKVSKELASLEQLAEYHRWLRGVLCFLALAAFLISLVSIENLAFSYFSDIAVTALSVLGEIAILRIYHIKARHAGVTNPIYHLKPSIIHSPHFFAMLLEMFIWTLHCPPGLMNFWANAQDLDFLIVLRFYTFLLYLNNAKFGYRTFCRAMSAIAEIPLSTSYFLRTSFMFDTVKTSLAVLVAGWCTLGLMFSKAEGIGFCDSMYFCFVTAATIGYGDISPKTTNGRFIAFFSWIFGLTVVAWVVGFTHEALSLSDPERNLFTLFQANQLCNVIPAEAAKTIQRAFRLKKAQRAGANLLRLNVLGYQLTTQVNTLRFLRRQLRSKEASFMNEMASFDAQPFLPAVHAKVNGTSPRLKKRGAPSARKKATKFPSPVSISAVSGDRVGDEEDKVALAGEEKLLPLTSPMETVSYTDCNVVGGDCDGEGEEMSEMRRPVQSSSESYTPSPCSPEIRQRVELLEKTLDDLILIAERIVRKKASNEDVRIADGLNETLRGQAVS